MPGINKAEFVGDMMPRHLISLCMSVFLAACVQFPDLDDAISDGARRAGFPTLVAIDPLLLAAQAGSQEAATARDQLLARIGALKTRARALRRPVIDRRTRARMNAALRRQAALQ